MRVARGNGWILALSFLPREVVNMCRTGGSDLPRRLKKQSYNEPERHQKLETRNNGVCINRQCFAARRAVVISGLMVTHSCNQKQSQHYDPQRQRNGKNFFVKPYPQQKIRSGFEFECTQANSGVDQWCDVALTSRVTNYGDAQRVRKGGLGSSH